MQALEKCKPKPSKPDTGPYDSREKAWRLACHRNSDLYGINRGHDESPTQTACSLIVNHYTLLSICLLWNPPRWVMTHDPWWTSVFHMLLNAQVAWTSRLAGGWMSCGRSHWGSSGRYAGWRESNGAWRGRSGSGLKNWHGVRRVSSRFSAPGIIKVVNHCCSQQFDKWMNLPS